MMKIKDFLPKGFTVVDNKYFLNFSGDSDCIYSGTYLGCDIDGDFVPSLMLLELIYDKFGSVILNQKNSWLFTCNRIITDVISDSGDKYAIVRNGINEILGLGQWDGRKLFPQFDIGHLLRRELE